MVFKGIYPRYSLNTNNVKVMVDVVKQTIWGSQTSAPTDQWKNKLKAIDVVKVPKSTIHDPVPRKCVGKQTEDNHQFKEVFRNVFVYSAFFDVRDIDNQMPDRSSAYTIRIMAALPVTTRNAYPTFYCVGLLTSGQYWSVQVSFYMMHERYNNGYDMYILSCRLPLELWHTPPCSVLISPSTAPRNTSQWINVQSPMTTLKHKVEICVPPLFGDISELELIEFIELAQLFGAEQIHFYNFKASPSVVKVLLYYKKLGFVSLLPWNLDSQLDNRHLHYHGQILSIQDCLYRNMFSTHLLAFMDIDEMFVPRHHSDWFSMVTSLQNYTQLAGVLAFSAVFDPRWQHEDNSSKSTQQLRLRLTHVIRTKQLSTRRTKCIVNPRHIFEMGIHHINKLSAANLKIVKLPEEFAVLHHYRFCPMKSPSDSCAVHITDNTLLAYASQLERNVKRVLVTLRL